MHTTATLAPAVMAHIRRRAIFDCCKWDPQYEDTDVLCPFALVLDSAEWQQLAAAARRLTNEVICAEAEILSRPALVRDLGLPRPIRRILEQPRRDPAVSGPRVMRFDFHLTSEGWRISEANTDVPGGFIEGGGFTQLIAQHFSSLSSAGNPAHLYATALMRRHFTATIALVHATAYTDDRQVMAMLAKELQRLGAQPLLVSPADISWSRGYAQAVVGGQRRDIDQIVRFFPAEWLPQLPRSANWSHFFQSSATPHSNPGFAILSQSKRFPLVWDRLHVDLTEWRRSLPETRDPRGVRWRDDGQWVLKPALGRVGDGIGLRGITAHRELQIIMRSAYWFPSSWAVQRRFEAVPVSTPDGLQYPVVGAFTIDGEPAGIYGRIADRPLIDHRARDIAVLIQQPAPAPKHSTPEETDELRAVI